MLSNTCKYGIRAVLYLAKSNHNEMVGLKKISEELDIPSPFLGKILQALARQKLLYSTKGPHGGFSILFDPAKTSLLDIVTAIDGPDVFNQCAVHTSTCKCMDESKKACLVHEPYSEIRTRLYQLFRSKSIRELADDADQSIDIMI